MSWVEDLHKENKRLLNSINFHESENTLYHAKIVVAVGAILAVTAIGYSLYHRLEKHSSTKVAVNTGR